MKNTSEQLDIFLRNTLRANDASASPVDWSEVEVLLSHERKPISVNFSKKTFFVLAGIVTVALVGFGIVKWAQHYASSSSSETGMPVVETKILTASDSQEVISESEKMQSGAVADTSETAIDSAALARTEHRADSLIADFKKKQAEEEKQKTEAKYKERMTTVQDTKKAEKKNPKISSLAPTIFDSDNAPDNILLPEDTSRSTRRMEIKKDSPSASDSSQVSTPKPKKGKKAKPDSTTVDSPSTDVSKPDSLK